MLQVFVALAFSTAPVTLFIPPMRNLNLLVETMEAIAKEAADYSLRALPRIQLGVQRVRARLMSLDISS